MPGGATAPGHEGSPHHPPHTATDFPGRTACAVRATLERTTHVITPGVRTPRST